MNRGTESENGGNPRVEPFERFPNRYEDWFARNQLVYKSELKAIRALLPEDAQGIEIGVGTGRFAAPLGIDSGIDPSKAMREIARKRGIKAVDGVAEALPYKNNQFGFALMVTTICFLSDIDKSLRETYRIIKPGGKLIVGFVDRNSSLGQTYQKHKGDNPFYKVASFLTVNEVTSYLKKAGFEDFSFIQTIFHDLDHIRDVEPIKESFGEGSFVVVRAVK